MASSNDNVYPGSFTPNEARNVHGVTPLKDDVWYDSSENRGHATPSSFGSGAIFPGTTPREIISGALSRLMVDERMLIFLWEMLAPSYEKGLFAALRNKPNDADLRAVCGDWLEDQGRMESASMVRSGWTPGK